MLTAVWTAAVRNRPNSEAYRSACRSVEIMADAAYGILVKDSRTFTGNFFDDEGFLTAEGIADMDQYRLVDSKLW